MSAQEEAYNSRTVVKRNGAEVQKDTPEIFGDVTRREGETDEEISEAWRQTKTRRMLKGRKGNRTVLMRCLRTYREMPGSHPQRSPWQKLFSLCMLR